MFSRRLTALARRRRARPPLATTVVTAAVPATRGLARAAATAATGTPPRSGAPSTASRTSPRRLRLARLRHRVRRGRDLDLHAGRHPGHRAAASGRAASARTRRYNDQVTIDGVQPPGRRVRHRPAQPPRGREAAGRPEAAARASRPAQMVRGYAAGVNRYLRRSAARRGHRPRLPAAPATCSRTPPRSTSGTASTSPTCSPRAGVFVKEIVDADPPTAERPRPARSCRSRRAPSTATKLLAALGKDPSSPFGSNATAIGGDATHHRPGHAARQPALPVARPLPVHPAAADDPRAVRRRRRLA